MDYSADQLKLIQRQTVRMVKELKEADGFGSLLVASEYLTWVSHAQLAGYSVDKQNGKLYQQKDNVRTYC